MQSDREIGHERDVRRGRGRALTESMGREHFPLDFPQKATRSLTESRRGPGIVVELEVLLRGRRSGGGPARRARLIRVPGSHESPDVFAQPLRGPHLFWRPSGREAVSEEQLRIHPVIGAQLDPVALARPGDLELVEPGRDEASCGGGELGMRTGVVSVRCEVRERLHRGVADGEALGGAAGELVGPQ